MRNAVLSINNPASVVGTTQKDMIRISSPRTPLGLRVLFVCALSFAGCGSAEEGKGKSTQAAGSPADGGQPKNASTVAATGPNADTSSAPASKGDTVPPANNVATSTSREESIAAPTSEQIARWTPAPFEPVQLLAIREWDKTSFTRCLAPAPDGKHFLVAGSPVLLWSLDGDQPEHVFLDLPTDNRERDILSLAVSPDGRWFAAGDSQGMLRVWSLNERQEIAAKKLGLTGIQWLAISPDGQEIATISYDSMVTTWSADKLEQQQKFKVDTNGLKRIEYLAAKMLAAAGESTSLWNTSTGELVKKLSPGRYSFALARSTDGTKFIFGGDDSLHIWNIAESKEEAEIKHGVSGGELLSFSPDGKFLATTNGRSLTLWNLAERRAVQMIDGFGWPIAGVSWLSGSNLLAVASEIGCTRIWGTPSQGSVVGLKPLHGPVAMPTADSKAPATISQLEQMIDLRTFPRLPGSEPNLLSRGNFRCVVSATADEVKSFYRYFLEKNGWALAKTPAANPSATEFRKDGFRLSLTCYDAGAGKTNVMLHHGGNYDLRWTLKFDAAPIETVHEADNTVSYRAKADLVQIETMLLRKLHAAGWTPYTRLNSSYSEKPDERDMSFLRNGTTMRVSIGKFPADPKSYTIQYSLFPNDCSVPIPQDSGFIEFDGSTEPTLVATTKMSLEQAQKFYDEQLASEGWLVRQQGRSLKEDHSWLSYIRGQSDVTVGLTKLPDGQTLVRVGKSAGSLWELSQQKKELAAKTDAVGLQAADFPAVSASKPAAFDALAKSIEIQVEKTTLAEAAERFTEKLAALGWTPEKGGIRSEDYTFFDFKKDGKEITLRARLQNGNAVVNFQGDGLLWTKELPTGRQVVSYETWLRLNKQPPGLHLLDRYEAEMRSIKAPQAEKYASS